jgi:hypothetical protein
VEEKQTVVVLEAVALVAVVILQAVEKAALADTEAA